jgi:photosystem II stability/assembly factor-like uncharacterized protein
MNYSCFQLDRPIRAVLMLLLAFTTMFLAGSQMTAQEREPKYDPEGELRRIDELHRGSETETNRESGEDIRGREEWFYFQRSFPYDMIPAGLRVNALRETQLFQQRIEQQRNGEKSNGRSMQAAVQWEQIGPYNIGGRIKALAVHPTQSGVIYVGAAAGGVWKTTDAGTTWTTTFDKESAIAVNALAIDHSNPRVVYVGTGEIFGPSSTPNASLAYLGDGIFKSTDDGATWKNMGLNNVGAISGIYVHRQNPSIVYATATLANAGFYRSTDGGTTWKQIVSGTYFDLAVNPANSDEVYIAGASSVRRSTDGGATFTAAGTGIYATNARRISIGIAESDPTRLYILVARDTLSGQLQLGEIYASSNKGTSWQWKYKFSLSFFNAQGWYDNCIAVHPTNPDVVLAGGIDVFRTTNGGTNWTNSTRSYSGGTTHPDQHVLRFDPTDDNFALLGNDGGLYRSSNQGANWTRLGLTLPITQYYALDVDPSRPFRVYGGTQDNGTHGSFGVSSFPNNWTNILGGDGFYAAVDLTNPNFVYGENYNGQPIYRINVTTSSASSVQIDGGISSSDPGMWSAPLVMSPADRSTLYSGRLGLWRTTSSPRTGTPGWQQLLPGNSNRISAVGLSPHNAAKMMIGTQGGEIRYSTNNGSSWNTPTGFPRRYVTDIVYDPAVDGIVYATFSGSGGQHVYVSLDDGNSFTDITQNLPDIPVNAIAIDSNNNQHIYVGTDVGVYASLNGGEVWIPYNDGLPLAPVTDLKMHNITRSLVAATHGRSMFRINIDNAVLQPLLIYPIGGETYLTPGKISVRWMGFDKPVRISISYDGGVTYTQLADDVSGDTTSVAVPFVKTTRARIKVVEIGTLRTLISSNFTLNPSPNTIELGTRNLKSQAIAVRKNYLWATQRGSDTIVKLKTPGLVPIGIQYLVRSGIPGTIRDLTYDAVNDLFYALVADADFGNAKVYRMDTNGVGQGTIELPVSTISGIASVPEGLALMTPGLQGKLYVIDPTEGTVISESDPLKGGSGNFRRGLVFDGATFVQGVTEARVGTGIPTELQRFMDREKPEITQVLPVVLPSQDTAIVFFGLAYDPGNSTDSSLMFFATDTSGAIFRFTLRRIPLGVEAAPGVQVQEHSVAIASVTPNPFRASTSIQLMVRSRQSVNMGLYSTTGERVGEIYSGELEPGNHSVALDAEALPSGIYHIVLTTSSGERVVQPVVIMQ